MRALGLATQADPRTQPWTDGAPCRMEAERGWPRCRCRRPQGEKDEDPTTQRGERTAPQNQGRRIAEPGAERPGAVTSLPGGAQEGRAPAASARPPPPASGSVPTRMTARWAPPCPPHPSGWRGAHDRAGLSVRALSSSSPRPRAGTTAAPPRGMEGLARARRSGRGDTGRRPGASRFRVLTTVLAAPPSRCPQDVERDRPVRALSPTGPRPAAVHQAVLVRLATPSPRETPPLAIPHQRDGGSPSLVAKAHLAAQAALHRGRGHWDFITPDGVSV